jgi:ketosteroid isomerase-like protein
MVRFPGAYRTCSALALRLLSPRLWLRQALLRGAVVSGWDAATRGDYELMLVRYAPDVEVEFDSVFEALGLGGTYRGHAGIVSVIGAFEEAWERRQSVPALILDLGDDRTVILGTFKLPGSASGVEFEREFAQLTTARQGLVARDQYFFDWDKGLRAAGLDPDAIALPTRPRS